MPEEVGLPDQPDDAAALLARRRISHLPVEERGRIVGLIGQTDLFRQQATTASHMAAEIVQAESTAAMAKVMERVPALLAQLVAAGTRPEAI
ncbi:MAG: CBS domain-containing protein, partial [Pseudomonadota bacterium]